MGVTGWGCVPLSVALAAGIAAIALRIGARAVAALRMVAIALLLPGLVLVFWPDRPGLWFWPAWPGSWTGGAMAGVHPAALRSLVCRTIGALPLLMLPVLAALHRMPPGQGRTASGLGAGRAAQLRFLWLPQLGPACLAGLLLAVLVDAASLHLAARTHPARVVVLPPPVAPT